MARSKKNVVIPVDNARKKQMEAVGRTIEYSVSADNLLQILYVTGHIHRGEEITKVVFTNSQTGVDLKNNPTVVVPLKVTVVKRENGKDG